MPIDFHTHIFPDQLAPRAVGALEKSSHTKAALGGTRKELVDSMRKNGVDYSVNMPIASRPDQTASINRFACEVQQKGEGLLSFGSVHPGFDGWIPLHRLWPSGGSHQERGEGLYARVPYLHRTGRDGDPSDAGSSGTS